APRAHAAPPTTSECLAASDASLKAGTDRKLRAERVQLLICAAGSCPAEIRKECTQRVDEVNAAIPTVVFEAKDASGNDLSDVSVRREGEALAARLDGSALGVDRGPHPFVFESPGQPPVTKDFVVREAEKERHETIRIGTPAAGTSAPPVASPSG